jgi:Methyltransferase domain
MRGRSHATKCAIAAVLLLTVAWQFRPWIYMNTTLPLFPVDYLERSDILESADTRRDDSLISVTTGSSLQESQSMDREADKAFSLPICTRNIYLTALEENVTTITSRMDHWLSEEQLNATRHEAQTNETLLVNWARYDFAFPLLAKCRPEERVCVGGPCPDDDSKVTCGVRLVNPSCIVYSLGGNNQWGFEEDLLNRTTCEIHTFDCTGPVERFDQKPDRVHFHHVCLGTAFQAAPANCTGQFKCGETWTLQQMKTNLGHDRIDLLKVDIEGFEWPLIQSWWEQFQAEEQNVSAGNSTAAAFVLPHQIMMEVHYKIYYPELQNPEAPGNPTAPGGEWSPDKVVSLHEKLLRMGYIVVEVEHNVFCPECTEITLLRARCRQLQHSELLVNADTPSVRQYDSLINVASDSSQHGSKSMEKAKHKPFSLPICSRNIYLTALEENVTAIASRMDHWLEEEQLNATRHEAQTNQTLLANWSRLEFALPLLAKCRPEERICVGGPCPDDDSKVTCGVRLTNPSCIVYSLGGNNQWGFENDLLNRTTCEIHTFDCTGPIERFDQKPDRVHFHHVCLGTEFAAAPADCTGQLKCGETWTLQQMKTNLGHDRIDLLKVDIEGFEWPLIQSWWDQFQAEEQNFSAGNSTAAAFVLPHQIMMEVHYKLYYPS